MFRIKSTLVSSKSIFLILFMVFSAQNYAQEKSLENFKVRMEKLVNTEWVAENPLYNDTMQYAPKRFRYVFSKGVHGEHMTISIFADLNTVGERKVWDGYYLWNPAVKEVAYHSIGFAGQVANGNVSYENDKSINLFGVRNYDGTLEDHKDETLLKDGLLITKTYTKDAMGNWTLLQELTWKKKTE